MPKLHLHIFSLFLPLTVFLGPVLASEDKKWDEKIIIIAEPMNSPLSLITDPKAPRQPIPSFDGSGFLRSIPGFNIARKGSNGGDISLRGLSGSRLSVVNNGQQMIGTCGGRMDPPTNYITPQTYDLVEVIKGPQTVKYGPIGSAGTVLFVRDHKGLTQPTFSGRLSTTAASFDRYDFNASTLAGNQQMYWQFNANSSQSADYKDGNGTPMQSSYNRYSVQTALGWTALPGHVFEIEMGMADGHAEYADRANRARKIGNDNLSLFYTLVDISESIRLIEYQVYVNKNDHIMDQFYKPYDPDEPHWGSNPQRLNQGGHIWMDIEPFDGLSMTVGVDLLNTTQQTHSATSYADLKSMPLRSVFSQNSKGLFIESTLPLLNGDWISGIRYDHWQTEVLGPWATLNINHKKQHQLTSGFSRYETLFNQNEYYIGLGYAQRIPDFWEVVKAGKKLTLSPEKTLQMDLGWIYNGPVDVSVAVYYGYIQDYILIDKAAKPLARNIDATVWGGELALTYSFLDNWQVLTTLVYSHGDNDTDHVPLGQISPVEMRLSLNYQSDHWSMGAFYRLVGKQDRVSIGQGNIVGQDLGESDGFNVLSINANYHLIDNTLISFGIDNLFNTAYAEHISKSGAGNEAVGITDRTQQVNEPGRTIWLNIEYRF